MPRATLILAGGFVLFLAVSLLYSLPVMLEPVPDGATPDYLAERVRAHLAGKTFIFLALSILAVAAFSARPWKR
ncbi:MAG TPA: hypothetical protein VKF60_08565 [Myxococcota bacterium]|nr:hypothetical protein [Myxococcota bacterium]